MHPPIHHRATGELPCGVFSVILPIRGNSITRSGSIPGLVVTKTAREESRCL